MHQQELQVLFLGLACALSCNKRYWFRQGMDLSRIIFPKMLPKYMMPPDARTVTLVQGIINTSGITQSSAKVQQRVGYQLQMLTLIPNIRKQSTSASQPMDQSFRQYGSSHWLVRGKLKHDIISTGTADAMICTRVLVIIFAKYNQEFCLRLWDPGGQYCECQALLLIGSLLFRISELGRLIIKDFIFVPSACSSFD